jgi:hypothetical protein
MCARPLRRVSHGRAVVAQTELSELPLGRYFRFAAPTANNNNDSRSSSTGSSELMLPLAASMNAGVVFSSLPGHQVLTMKVETPEPWIAPVTYAQHDMDNLQVQKCG